MSSIAAETAHAEHLLAEADRLADAGQFLDAIDTLHRANQESPDAGLECRLAELRHEAFAHLPPASAFDQWPVPIGDLDRSEPAHIPKLLPSELTADAVRRAIQTHGSVHVPGLLGPERVQTFIDGIENSLAIRAELADRPMATRSSWFRSLPLPRDDAALLARQWVAGDGGILACDAPKLLDLLFVTYEEVGLRQVVQDYLGERPVLSANKATLRRARLEGKTDWHQDGAFMGSRIRALNVWVTLTDCGVDAPGMDIVPKRFETIQETGTGGAIFDWAVGPDTVAGLSVDAPVVRPQYRAGDAMLFDDMLLHRTALDPGMTRTRHAIESWFFARTDYPVGQVPLVW